MEIGIPHEWIDGPETVVELVRARGGDPVRGSLADLVDRPPDTIVVEGDAGVVAAVRAGCDSPVLPVDAMPGLEPIDRESLPGGIDALLAGKGEPVTRRGIAITVDGTERARALFDGMVMTTEPASISAYDLRSEGASIGHYRADGVVVASAVGSGGYARAAGGPVLGPRLDAVSVVPISPYRTAEDHWILAGSGVELRITRDETDVTLFADDRTVETVSADVEIGFSTVPLCETVRLPQSRSPFEHR